MRLNDAPVLYSSSTSNACVASALASITGIPAEDWVAAFRKRHPRACTPRRGTSRLEYLPALQEAGWRGYRVKGPEDWGWKGVPLHVALRDLHRAFPNKAVMLIVRERRQSAHAVAALGFMVADNTSIAPRFWSDWADLWQKNRIYPRPGSWRISQPRPPLVKEAFVIERAQVFA